MRIFFLILSFLNYSYASFSSMRDVQTRTKKVLHEIMTAHKVDTNKLYDYMEKIQIKEKNNTVRYLTRNEIHAQISAAIIGSIIEHEAYYFQKYQRGFKNSNSTIDWQNIARIVNNGTIENDPKEFFEDVKHVFGSDILNLAVSAIPENNRVSWNIKKQIIKTKVTEGLIPKDEIQKIIMDLIYSNVKNLDDQEAGRIYDLTELEIISEFDQDYIVSGKNNYICSIFQDQINVLNGSRTEGSRDNLPFFIMHIKQLDTLSFAIDNYGRQCGDGETISHKMQEMESFGWSFDDVEVFNKIKFIHENSNSMREITKCTFKNELQNFKDIAYPLNKSVDYRMQFRIVENSCTLDIFTYFDGQQYRYSLKIINGSKVNFSEHDLSRSEVIQLFQSVSI